MNDSWHSYPSIFAMGHRAIADLLNGPVWVEEKVDGSQFSFGVFETYDAVGERDGGTVLRVRSKGAVMIPDAPEPMFAEAVDTAKQLAPMLRVGWTYRGEYLKKPRHNGLAYDRIPKHHVILFDINSGHETYLSQDDKRQEADRLGLEVVPLLSSGVVTDIAAFRAFLDRESILGGQKIEGVVVKPHGYDRFGPDKKCLMGKFVSEAFKEVQSKFWKADNVTQSDILTQLGDTYGTLARWHKAAQHMRDRGQLEGSPRDISALIKEVPEDIKKECEDDIKAQLFAWAWPHLRRLVTRRLPEWYKDELLRQQFEQPPAVVAVDPSAASTGNPSTRDDSKD
jgi:hypothetical protein